MSRISLILADDHPVVRSGLKHILDTQPDLLVVGEADDGRDALRQVEECGPDIVIMDISMPNLNGIEATRHIRDSRPETGIIILSMHSSTRLVFRAIQAGAQGYLLKGAANNEILLAIRAVYRNQLYLSDKVLDQFSHKALDQLRALDNFDFDPVETLSSREREVLQLVVEGKTSAEIARQLYLSAKTVETYRHRLMRKLNIQTIPDLVRFAIQNHLTPPE